MKKILDNILVPLRESPGIAVLTASFVETVLVDLFSVMHYERYPGCGAPQLDQFVTDIKYSFVVIIFFLGRLLFFSLVFGLSKLVSLYLKKDSCIRTQVKSFLPVFALPLRKR